MRQFKAMKNKIPGGWWVIHDPSGTEIPRGSEEPSLGGGGGAVWIFCGITH